MPADEPAFGCATSSLPCPKPPHASASCIAGACHSTCLTGWGDCDASMTNGCETDLTLPTSCGACGQSCGVGQKCSETAGCVPLCMPPETDCNGRCVDLFTSPRACGGCSTVCTASYNEVPTCQAGSCVNACAPGYVPCGNDCARLDTYTSDCGACNNDCTATPGSFATCMAGQCGTACTAGLTKCSGICVDLDVDEQNCGACGATCTGTCAEGSCDTSFNPVVASGVDPGALAVDDAFVYWNDSTAGSIHRAPKTGGAVQTIATAQQQPGRVAVDATHVYWGNVLGGAVLRALKSGGPAELVATAVAPKYAAVDASWVYWARAQGPSQSELWRAPKTGGAPQLLYQVADQLLAMEIDDTHVYAVGFAIGAPVYKVAKAGGAATLLNFLTPAAGDLALGSHYAYLNAGSLSNRLTSTDKVSGIETPIQNFSTVDKVREVDADDSSVFWLLHAGTTTTHSIRRRHACGGEPLIVATLWADPSPISNNRALAVDESFVYWWQDGDIRRAAK